MADATRVSQSFFSAESHGEDPLVDLRVIAENTDGDLWLDYEHDEVQSMRDKWRYVHDHYSGALLDEDKIEDYLIRRSSAEGNEEYAERKGIVAYKPILSHVVDTFVGLLAGAESEAVRVFQPEEGEGGLGDIEDRMSTISKLWDNLDGRGTNYLPYWQTFATDLMLFNRMWTLADGVQVSPDGETIAESRLVQLPPWTVPNWKVGMNGVLSDVVVKTYVDGRGDITSKPGKVERFTHYYLDGWTQYEIRETDAGGGQKKRVAIIVGEGQYEFYADMEMTTRTLPIFPTYLPTRRNISYNGARLANGIFNMMNERAMNLRKAMITRFALVANTEQFKAHLNHIKQGYGTLMHDPGQGEKHYYIAPPVDAAKHATEVLDSDIRSFYVTMFQGYADAARERTATEIRQESRAGIEAYLRVLSDALDEAENRGLFLLEQIEHPSKPAMWGYAQVERFKDFSPIDTGDAVSRLHELAFGPGKPLPMGPTAKKNVAKRELEYFNVGYDDTEVDTAVETANADSERENSVLRELGL